KWLGVAGFMCAAVCVAAVVWVLRGQRAPRPVEGPTSPEIVIDNAQLADAGVLLAFQYTGPIRDLSSLRDLREAIDERGRAALSAVARELADLERSPAPAARRLAEAHYKIGRIQIYLGRYAEALDSFKEVRRLSESAGATSPEIAQVTAWLGLTALRRGE